MTVDASTQYGTLRFSIPDLSVPPNERGMIGLPPSQYVEDRTIALHDVRYSEHIVMGPPGLDIQGFAYVRHESTLESDDQWLEHSAIEERYLKECEELIRSVTKAKTAIAINCAFRRKLPTDLDEKIYIKPGDTADKQRSSFPKDRPLITPSSRSETSEPGKKAHVDYSIGGLRATARFSRKDIKAATQHALDAEDRGSAEAPRYAIYSVWRPLKTVTRDPLAVCDWRTVNSDKDFIAAPYRALSDVLPNGEYMMEYFLCGPPEDRDRQSWYYMSNQTTRDVLIVKFADTESERDARIAAHCAHGAAVLPGTEDEPARESVECRVLAVW